MSAHQKPYTLERDTLGRLVLIDAAGTSHIGVYPVRAFPITAPGAGISIMDQSGKELCWFDGAESIPDAELGLIEEELAAREFMPVIEKITKVSTFATPSIWDIDTDRGPTRIRLKGEEDKVSKKWLDRFR
jgi:hypothetical protein